MLRRVKFEQGGKRNKGQTLVEYVLLLPTVCFFAYMSFIFYQGFVQGNLYGRTAAEQRYFSEVGSEAYGQEMAVALPFP